MRRLRPIAHTLTRNDRREPVLQEVDRGCPDAAARRCATENRGVDALRGQNRDEVRAEERGGALFENDRLVLPPLEPRINLNPGAAHLELAQRGRLLEPKPAVPQAR